MVLVLFATTFALSCGMFELIIFEIADVLSRPFVQEAMPLHTQTRPQMGA